MDVIVNIVGITLIAVIVWWFWLAKPVARRVSSAQAIEIVVADGTYSPARIEVPTGRPTTLRFIRKDPSPCAEQVIFHDLDVSAALSLDDPVEVSVTVPRQGEYTFTCQMQMYRGTLVGV
ncbi:MAG: plastocyanin [Gammaproteobacteria bacterium SG8_47]|nr:MAG: plastocyanin [Gammaproteobacteria bacterium SG8_47]